MRTSQAGLACITRVGPNGVEYLTQWNDRWQMYSLIGGHIGVGERYRDCCIREVEEELELQREAFTVGESLGCIEYEAFSHGSGVMTHYVVELFAVALTSDAIQQKVTADATNRWLSGREVVTMKTHDGRPISEQVRTVLSRCGVLPVPTVFVSATSRDLKSYRLVVADWAKARGYAVVVQDEFPVMSDYGTIVNMLRDKLAPCDAVIHLAGLFYGFEPTNRPDGEARRSYTQLEYELGKELKRQVFRFIARPDYTPDTVFTQSDEQRELQWQHRQRLTSGNELYYEFSSHDELRKLLDQLAIKDTLAKPQNLPLVGSLFKGRDEFLDQLRSVLVNKPTHIAAVTAKQAIHGLGGVGKTRVAVEYAKRYSHEYTALLFITADTESSLKSNLANLCGAMVLNLPEQAAREQEVQVAAALRWLREHAGWFLIVDNVDTPEAATAVEELLQKLDTGHVVITSRLSNWGHAVQELALDVLKPEAAVELLLHRTNGKRKVLPADADDAKALANDLGYLPLALEQAGAYIVELGISFAEYRADWKKHDDDVLTWFDPRAMKYPKSVATTWETSFARLGENGRGLLNLLCWLAPEPIPTAMLDKLTSEDGEPPIKIKIGIADLVKYSFLKWPDESHTSVVVHRLVQEITEYRLPQAEKRGWLMRSLRMLDKFCVGDPTDTRIWPTVYRPVAPHVVHVAELQEGETAIQTATRVLNVVGVYASNAGDYSMAERLLRRKLQLELSNLINSPETLATAEYNLANILAIMGRRDEAVKLVTSALDRLDNRSNPVLVGELLSLLGTDCTRRGEYGLAVDYLRRAVRTLEQPGGSVRHLSNALNHLGEAFRLLGRLDEAEMRYELALALLEGIDSDSHGHTASLGVRNNIGLIRLEQERYAEAEKIFRGVLAEERRRLPEGHPHIARNLNNLALALRGLGQNDEAANHFTQAIEIDTRNLGHYHQLVGVKYYNLGEVLGRAGRFSEALAASRTALEINRKCLGDYHTDVARDHNSLGAILHKAGRVRESLEHFRQAVLVEFVLVRQGRQSQTSLVVMNNFGGTLHALGHSQAAVQAELMAMVRNAIIIAG